MRSYPSSLGTNLKLDWCIRLFFSVSDNILSNSPLKITFSLKASIVDILWRLGLKSTLKLIYSLPAYKFFKLLSWIIILNWERGKMTKLGLNRELCSFSPNYINKVSLLMLIFFSMKRYLMRLRGCSMEMVR